MNSQPVGSPIPRLQGHGGWLLAISLAGLLLVAVLPDVLRAQATPGQRSTNEVKATVHFASLRYTPTGGKSSVHVPAGDVARIQLVRSTTGEAHWLELFYHQGDYVLQRVDSITFYRRDGALQQMKVAVNLVGMEKMGFPFVN